MTLAPVDCGDLDGSVRGRRIEASTVISRERYAMLLALKHQSLAMAHRLNGAIIVPIVADGDWP